MLRQAKTIVDTLRPKKHLAAFLFCLSLLSKYQPLPACPALDTVPGTVPAFPGLDTAACIKSPEANEPAVADTAALIGHRVSETDSIPSLPPPADAKDSLSQMLLNEFFLSEELRFYDAGYRYKPEDSAKIETWNRLALNIPAYKSPDSVYRSRLDSLSQGFLVKLSYNQTVRNYIEVYVNKRRQQVDVMLALSQYYFPIFEQAMEKNGVPKELKYLAIIESGLNPRAVSRAGASGCWQFMYGTGRMYDLDINIAVDERLDPFKASDAAARYLKDLYDSFGDWTLAIAAYNCGPGNVRKAIRRARGKTDFWQIYPFLPRETRSYVPAFIGATYAMNFNEEHGIPFRTHPPILTDTLMIDKDLNLKVVAKHLNIPLQILRDLNPQYRMDVIPGNTDYYSIRLPVNFKIKFMENEQDIYSDSCNAMAPTPARFQHRVKRGETLSEIAMQYHVRVADIMRLNNLKSSTIYPNQLLYLYSNRLPSSSRTTAQTAAAPSSSKMEPGTRNGDARTIRHTVRQGETLYGISRRYPGSTVNAIIQCNGLDKQGKIYPGQVLQIETTH